MLQSLASRAGASLDSLCLTLRASIGFSCQLLRAMLNQNKFALQGCSQSAEMHISYTSLAQTVLSAIFNILAGRKGLGLEGPGISRCFVSAHDLERDTRGGARKLEGPVRAGQSYCQLVAGSAQLPTDQLFQTVAGG